MNGAEVGDGGAESLEDLEVYVDTSRRAVVHVWMTAGEKKKCTIR